MIFKSDANVSTSHQWDGLGWICVCVCVFLFCWFVLSAFFFLINNGEFIFILLVLELWFPTPAAITGEVLYCVSVFCRSFMPAGQAQVQIEIGFLWLLFIGKASVQSRYKPYILLAHPQWPTETRVQISVGKPSAVVLRGVCCQINNFMDSKNLIDNWYLSCIIVSVCCHWVQLYSLVASIDFNQNM